MKTISFNQVASLTEEDIARIADRERAKAHGDKADQDRPIEGRQTAETNGVKQRNNLLAQPGSSRQSVGTIDAPGTSQLRMGVPIAVGPNVTKFFYVEVPDSDEVGQPMNDFDVAAAAAHLCDKLRKEMLGGELSACMSHLSATLRSR